jgi:hypothetical protein
MSMFKHLYNALIDCYLISSIFALFTTRKCFLIHIASTFYGRHSAFLIITEYLCTDDHGYVLFDGQQFHQYQQNKQLPITSNN